MTDDTYSADGSPAGQRDAFLAMNERLVALILAAKPDGWDYHLEIAASMTGHDRLKLELWRDPEADRAPGMPGNPSETAISNTEERKA